MEGFTNHTFKKQPWWFRGVNGAWRATYALGTEIKLDRDDLIKRARKAAGLHDLGKDFNEEPLDRLLRSINEEAELHPAGRFITRERFTGLIVARLRVEEWFRRCPEILEQELYPASIIVGLQRTGTTKLLRLLAVDPDHRVIPSWEVINPVPAPPHGHDTTSPPGPLSSRRGGVVPSKLDVQKRIRAANQAVTAVKWVAPDFFAIHPIEVMEPEEDILLLDMSFMSTTPEAMMHVPSYAAWLEKTDQAEAYAWYVKMLKFLQYRRPATRWVLKTPHHLEFTELIGKHFPKVEFLWPHRTLYESVPSFLSMVTYNHMIFSNRIDIDRIAGHWVRKTGYMLDKAIAHRTQEGMEGLFVDIWYKDLVKDSIAELDKIYRRNGGLTAELTLKMRRHEKEHPPKKYGAHKYSLSDFGLKEQDIDRYTRNYQEFINRNYGKSS